jgi:hypothetical protein
MGGCAGDLHLGDCVSGALGSESVMCEQQFQAQVMDELYQLEMGFQPPAKAVSTKEGNQPWHLSRQTQVAETSSESRPERTSDAATA